MLETKSNIEWDSRSQMLRGWAIWNNRRVQICIPRDLIDTISEYNDAVEYEIERFKHEIVEKLKPVLLAQELK